MNTVAATVGSITSRAGSAWRHQVLPRLIDITLDNKGIHSRRRRCIEGISGVVVEPGFGSGLNLPHLPPEVTKVYAIDPAYIGQKLASDRIAESSIPVEFIGLDGLDIPLPDNSCDSGLLTYTLCTIADHDVALAELRRVIKPGGRLHFLEHGASPEPSLRRWQDRLTPIQQRVADGCNLNKEVLNLIENAGFTIEWSHSEQGHQPKVGTYFVTGVAANGL